MMKIRVLATLLAVIGVLVMAGTAVASCTPSGSKRVASSGHWWSRMVVGPDEGSNCLTRTYANIGNGNPYIYPYGGITSAWVMLIDESEPKAYAQVGWLKNPDGTRNNFSEVNASETNWNYSRVTYAANAVGDTPEYKMTYISNYFHFLIDGSDYRDFSSPSYGGCGVEQSGEIQNIASQMPGESISHDVFTNPYIWDGSYHESHLWTTLTGDVYGHPAGSFGNSTTGYPVSQMDIWDTCS